MRQFLRIIPAGVLLLGAIDVSVLPAPAASEQGVQEQANISMRMREPSRIREKS
jgi:hypothetical protein